MRTRTVLLIGVGLLLGAIISAGVGMALASGSNGAMPWSSAPAASGSQTSTYSPGGMMGTNQQYPMMGPNGGMMGRSGNGQSAVPAQTTPVVGVTQVTIQNYAYSPASIQVKVGDTVTWTNQDTVPHSVTFKNGMKDSGLLQKGQNFRYTFTTVGTYDYYCTLHPYMLGRVTATA